MKIFKKLSFSFALILVLSFTVRAQGDIANLIQGGIDGLKDANTLSKAYLEPFGKGFGASLNSGWYNTAKPHKLFGFDLTFTIATAIPPSSAKTFDVSKLDLKLWSLKAGESNLSSTVTGSGNGTVLTALGSDMPLPNGADLKFIPAPMVQVGIGLPFNTELDFRILPQIKIPDVGQFSLWGFGIKNEFKEFIPGFKALPFNVSGFFGYTKFKSSFDAKQDALPSSNQKLNFDASGYTAKVLISKSIPVLTVYAGAGYSKSTTDVALKGDFDLDGVIISDPITLGFKNSGMSANIGLRIKLAIIAFHFDYTVGAYKLYNAGVGINFR